MKRFAFFIYGLVCYLMFFAVYAYFCGFVGNYFVPKTIDSPAGDPIGLALAIDLGLIAPFGLQHSIMARPGFKQFWTRFVPHPIERSTYVLVSNLVVMLLLWQWRAIDIPIWHFELRSALLCADRPVRRGLAVGAGRQLDDQSFRSVRPAASVVAFERKEYTALPFRTPMFYGRVRHPLYVGWVLAFWVTPMMSLGHLLFAATLTAYMVLASKIEEARPGRSLRPDVRRLPTPGTGIRAAIS